MITPASSMQQFRSRFESRRVPAYAMPSVITRLAREAAKLGAERGVVESNAKCEASSSSALEICA